MKIKEIMSKNIISCKSNNTIYEIANLMKKHNIGFLPIIDKSLKGVITDRDIVVKCLSNNDTFILPYINTNIISIEENKNIEDALNLMSKNKIKRLIITKEKEIVGILSLSDIINNTNINTLNTIKNIFELKNNQLNKNPKIDEFYL